MNNKFARRLSTPKSELRTLLTLCMYRAFCIIYYLQQQKHTILTKCLYRKELYDKDTVGNILRICPSK